MNRRQVEPNDEVRGELVRKVEAALRRMKLADPRVDESVFLAGAMLAFHAVYAAEDESRLPVAPPKWILNPIGGRSIFE